MVSPPFSRGRRVVHSDDLCLEGGVSVRNDMSPSVRCARVPAMKIAPGPGGVQRGYPGRGRELIADLWFSSAGGGRERGRRGRPGRRGGGLGGFSCCCRCPPPGC